MDALIFDMDGTLWDAVDSYSEVWNETFRELEQQTLRGFTPEETASLLALLDRAIANLYETQEEPRPCSND